MQALQRSFALLVSVGLAQIVLTGACAQDTARGETRAGDAAPEGPSLPADGAPHSPDVVLAAPPAICTIVPIEPDAGDVSQQACPPTPPAPPAPCQPGITCQYVRSSEVLVDQIIATCGPANTYVLRSSVCQPYCPAFDPSTAAAVEGAACGERRVHECGPAMPGMTGYDRLAAAVEALADGCGLPSHGSGAGVRVWFEGDCARGVEAQHREPIGAVRDCLAQKLSAIRISCVQGFPCAGISRALD
jgi:hypothetical protein